MRNLIFLFCLLIACQASTEPDPEPDPKETEEKLSDEALLDLVQENTIQYFWEGAEPNSGMAPERIHLDGVYPSNDQHIVTSGGTGFGMMAILVGIERGFITRAEGLARFQKMVAFLEEADRFHGVWPHWIDGNTGRVKPFSPKDDGGDLVETSFLVQGMLCVRQYFADGNPEEQALAADMDSLWRTVEWDWYQ
ncbi:MAG: beta-glucosidase, partial [Bacteroidota bacterium]